MTMTFLAQRKCGRNTLRTIVAKSIANGLAALRRQGLEPIQLLSARLAD